MTSADVNFPPADLMVCNPNEGERAEWPFCFLGAARQCLWNLELGLCYFDRLFINRSVIAFSIAVSKVSWNASCLMHESTRLWNCLIGACWYKFSITYMGLTLKKQLAEKSLFHLIQLFSLGPDLIHKCQIRGKEEDTGSLINLENKKFPFSCSLHITRQELMSHCLSLYKITN